MLVETYPLDDDSAVTTRRDLLSVRSSTAASVPCASDCDSEEVWYVRVIVALVYLRPPLNYYFYNIPRCHYYVLFDYTIQAVWSFFTNQMTSITDRKARIASGEEMLPHFGIR